MPHEYSDNDSERDSLMNEDLNERNKGPSYENALSAIGFGKFHALLYIVCALANASDAIEILCVSFVLPSAACDLNMSSGDKGLLSSMTFGGMLIGGYVWGTLSDIYGRKYMLISALVFNAFFGILCGLSQSFWLLSLFRFMSGIGVGGSVPIVWSYFSEFMPKNIRGRMICALASSWLFGNLLVILIAYMILNSTDFSYILLDSLIVLNNWRVFMICCSIPSLLTAFLLLFLPESPKFYFYNGMGSRGKQTLKNIYLFNNRTINELEIEKKRKVFEMFDEIKIYAGKNNQSDDEEGLVEASVQSPVSNSQRYTGLKYMVEFFKSSTSEAYKKTFELFKAPYTFNTCLILFIFFCLCFAYYGLWMWLPELFKRMSITGGSPCTSSGNPGANTTTNSTCHIEQGIYLDSLISALSNLPGNIITIIYVDKIGRNKITSLSLLASGVTVFGIPFVRTKTEGVLLTTLFGGINVLTFNSFGCTSTELYPTRLRSTALGVQFVAARFGAILGNIVFGLAVDISCFIPLCTISILLVSSGLLSFRLPESSQIDIS